MEIFLSFDRLEAELTLATGVKPVDLPGSTFRNRQVDRSVSVAHPSLDDPKKIQAFGALARSVPMMPNHLDGAMLANV